MNQTLLTKKDYLFYIIRKYINIQNEKPLKIL